MDFSANELGAPSPDVLEAASSSLTPLAQWKLRDVLISVGLLAALRVAAFFADRLHGWTPSWALLLLAMILPQLFLFAWPMLLLRRRGETLADRRPRREGWLLELMLGVVLAGGMLIVVIAAGNLLKWLAPDTSLRSQEIAESVLGGPWYKLLLLLLFASVVAPICEETFFRGFLYDALRQRLPLVWAIVLQAVVFGAVHTFGAVHSVLVAGVAVVLALLYQWRQTLITPMIAHSVFNSVQILLLISLKMALLLAPYLGVEGKRHDDGFQVVQVAADSPAEKAGILAGDLITAIGEEPVKGFLDVQVQLLRLKPGDEITIHLLRDGEAKIVTAILGKRP
ncbi:MAG: PDZ domain-containing protein [Pirellulaceae bacterium]